MLKWRNTQPAEDAPPATLGDWLGGDVIDLAWSVVTVAALMAAVSAGWIY